jgi:MoxR-like ATPase
VRGGQSLLLAAKVHALFQGRPHVAFSDLTRVAAPALRHRVIPSFEAEAEGVGADTIVARLLSEVPELPPSVGRIAS